MLNFNASKCKVMHVGHKLNTKYYMNEQDGNMELSAVHEEKDLGVYYAALLPRRGPHIASHSVCLSVCLSVCPSVPLSIVTERHVAPPSELQ